MWKLFAGRPLGRTLSSPTVGLVLMSSPLLPSPLSQAIHFDEDGFFHTGDIVEQTTLAEPLQYRVIDRIKNCVKLGNGLPGERIRLRGRWSATSVAARITEVTMVPSSALRVLFQPRGGAKYIQQQRSTR